MVTAWLGCSTMVPTIDTNIILVKLVVVLVGTSYWVDIVIHSYIMSMITSLECVFRLCLYSMQQFPLTDLKLQIFFKVETLYNETLQFLTLC